MTETPNPTEAPESPDRLETVHVWQIQAVRDVLLLVLVLAVLRLGYEMSAITVPLLVALGLAYLFEPLISLLQTRFRWKRTTAVSIILGLFIGGVVLVVVPVSLLVVGQTASLVQNVASGRYANAFDKGIALLPEETRASVESARDWLESTVPGSARIFGDDPDQFVDPPTEGTDASPADATTTRPPASKPTGAAGDLDAEASEEETIRRLVAEEVSRQLAGEATLAGPATGVPAATDRGDRWSFGSAAIDVVGSGARKLWSLALGVVEIGLLVFLVPFYFFFFATSYPHVVRFVRGLVPHEHRDQVFHLVGAMDRAVSGFVRGRLVISVILGSVFAIGWLVVGVPYSLALGLVIGIFCAVPYLSAIGVPVAIGLLAVDQFSLPEAERYAWWGVLLWPALVYWIGQSLDDWVLTPLIQGKATDLDPVSIVVAVLAGGSLAGLYGMLLAVPAAACVKILLREVLMPRIRDWSAGRVRDPLPGG